MMHMIVLPILVSVATAALLTIGSIWLFWQVLFPRVRIEGDELVVKQLGWEIFRVAPGQDLSVEFYEEDDLWSRGRVINLAANNKGLQLQSPGDADIDLALEWLRVNGWRSPWDDANESEPERGPVEAQG